MVTAKYWVGALVLVSAIAPANGQQARMEPLRERGQSVTAAYEGWYQNADGSYNLLVGYMNRNTEEELDIPIGPNNRIEPGGPDRGQPTHFVPRRGWGVFTITVPKDFGKNKLTWTLTANGVTTSVPFHLDPLWEVAPFKDATNNTPPYLGFTQDGPFANGPKGQSTAMKATVNTPTPLAVFAADDANLVPGAAKPNLPAVLLTWSKFRGPGDVKFANARPAVENSPVVSPGKTVVSGKAATTVTFSEPGEYLLKITANDWSGDGGRGFQCCWSNAMVKVTVSAAGK